MIYIIYRRYNTVLAPRLFSRLPPGGAKGPEVESLASGVVLTSRVVLILRVFVRFLAPTHAPSSGQTSAELRGSAAARQVPFSGLLLGFPRESLALRGFSPGLPAVLPQFPAVFSGLLPGVQSRVRRRGPRVRRTDAAQRRWVPVVRQPGFIPQIPASIFRLSGEILQPINAAGSMGNAAATARKTTTTNSWEDVMTTTTTTAAAVLAAAAATTWLTTSISLLVTSSSIISNDFRDKLSVYMFFYTVMQ